MKSYWKKIAAGVFLTLGLLLLSISAQAADTDGQYAAREVMRITARTGGSEVKIPVYAEESYWYGYNFWVEDGYDLLLASRTASVSVSVDVLDKNDAWAAIEPGVIDENTEIIISSTEELEDRAVIRYRD